jgi:hypothetical protein
MNPNLIVHEAHLDDIPLIVDYWMNSSDSHLIGMRVDLKKLPNKKELTVALTRALDSKKLYTLIWDYNGDVERKEAYMHIHLWKNKKRKQGIVTYLIKKSLPLYFKNQN